MKIKILLLTFCTLLTFQLAAQQSWRQQRGKIANKQKIALQNHTLSRNSIATNRSSQKEGEVWNKIASDAIPLGHEVNSIKMANENIIWMASSVFIFGPPSEDLAIISKSVDGGLTWEQFSIPNTAGFYAVDIAAVDENIAYATLWGSDFFNDLSQDAVYKTIDGGKNWQKLDSYPHSPTYIHFFNETEGWVLGFDNSFTTVMSVTVDGGVTWNHAGGEDWVTPEGRSLPLRDNNDFVGTFSYAPGSNYEVVDSTIIIGGTSYWISHDRGYSWERFMSPLFEEEGLIHGSVAMKDPQTFMFASNLDLDFTFGESTAYATTDGGQTWTRSNVPVNPSAVAYLPGTENDFIITGQDQGFDPSFGFGITGTARTGNLKNWDIMDDKGLLAVDFMGENQSIGAFANYPGTTEASNMYRWGEKQLLDYESSIVRNNVNPFTIATLNHLSEELVYEYEVQNIGANDLVDMTLTMEVVLGGSIIATESEIIVVNQGSSDVIVFTYTPTQIGLYEFNITANQSNIGDAFFKDIRFFEVSETTIGKDDGIGDLSFSIIPDSDEWTHGYLGSEFNLLVADKLASFSVVVDDGFADSTGLFNFIIKAINSDGEAEDGEIYKFEAIPIIDLFNNLTYATVVLPEPVDLPAGDYIFAVGQDIPQATINFGFDDKSDSGFWMYSPVGFDGEAIPWTNITDGSFPTLMLRPNFQAETSTSSLEQKIAETTPLTIFPIPFKDELNVLLEYVEEKEVNIQIFDMTGKQWTNFTTSHHQVINQNLTALPKGLYLMSLKSGLYHRSVKVLKQ